MINLKNVNVSFGKKQVLSNLNFNFEKGKKYAIMGESGCGKTTILNAIAGLVKLRAGETAKPNNCKFAYVFQEPRLFNWLTVLENVSVVSELSKSDADNKSKEILSSLGLSFSISLYPQVLSGGMKQRVSLARALAFDADVILLDEPFKALDPETKKITADYVFEYLKDKTVIMVTHDPTDLKYADVILNVEDSPITHLNMVKTST